MLLLVIAPGVDIPAAAVAAVVLIEYQVQVPVRLGGVEDALLGRVNGLFPRGILDPGILLGQLFQVLVDGGRRLVQLLPLRRDQGGDLDVVEAGVIVLDGHGDARPGGGGRILAYV